MKWMIAALLALAVMSGPATADRIAGTWNLSVDSPHGSVGMTLTLREDDQKVSGTLTSDHTGELKVHGEWADGKLSLQTEGGMSLTLAATLKDEALSGYLSTEGGDMKFTGERAKGQ
jgi:hypothetical protein